MADKAKAPIKGKSTSENIEKPASTEEVRTEGTDSSASSERSGGDRGGRNDRGGRGGGRGGRGGGRGDRGGRDDKNSEWDEKVVSLRRAAKVTTGGKRFRFNAIVIVGNKKGKVGLGYGKANELADAIKKAKDRAIKNAKTVNTKSTTIPYEVQGKFKSGVIYIKPASKGTGVIAGGAVRPVIELAGIKDVLTKSLRSTNPVNLVKATLSALYSLEDAKDVAARREITVQQVFGDKA